MTTANIESVCSLDPEPFQERLAETQRKILPHVTGTHELADGLLFEFDASPAMRAQLEAWVAVERTCCTGLSWQVRETSSKLHLHIDGVDPREFRSRIESQAAVKAGAGSGLGRIAKAAGVGLGGSVLLFCVLPLGLALILGGAVAAPFAGLDDPLWIGAGSLALAVPAWLLSSRRRRNRAEPGCGC